MKTENSTLSSLLPPWTPVEICGCNDSSVSRRFLCEQKIQLLRFRVNFKLKWAHEITYNEAYTMGNGRLRNLDPNNTS